MDNVTIESLKETRRALSDRSDRRGVADCDVKIAELEAALEANTKAVKKAAKKIKKKDAKKKAKKKAPKRK